MKSGSLNISGMPYRRSGHAGGKSVSMIGMLVLLMAALLVLPSCFDDDDTETVTVKETQCYDGTTAGPGETCPEPPPVTPPETPTQEPECRDLGSDDNMWTGGDNDELICGGDGKDTLKGMAGDDTLYGGAGDDTLYGGEGRDTLDGGADDDTLDGQEGDDVLKGGEGNDMLTGGSGDDEMDGGPGTDTASYARSSAGVQVDLSSDDIRSEGDAARDTLTNIENLVGSVHDDQLTGDDGDNVLTGLAGSDMLDGGAGNDTASYAGSMDAGAVAGVTVSIAEYVTGGDVTNAPSGGHAATDEIKRDEKVDHDGDENTPTREVSTIENLTGSDGNDTLTGDYRDNILTGGKGMDTLMGGGGDDMLFGGDDNDTTLEGGMGNDTISGGKGNDALTGGMGNDTLMGGPGQDTFAGEEGSDTYHVDSEDGPNAITEVDDADSTCDDKSTTPLVERCTDTVIYSAYKKPVAAEDQETGLEIAIPANVEVLHATRYNDTLRSDSTDGATILGHEGDDIITGGTGMDVLVGCAGKNMLNSGLTGDEGDVFGVFNDGENFDSIMDFEEGDEIHLKGFAADAAVDVVELAGSGGANKVGVTVNNVKVAEVTAPNIGMAPATDTTPELTKTENMVAKLKANNTKGMKVTRIVSFDSAKCSSPE